MIIRPILYRIENHEWIWNSNLKNKHNENEELRWKKNSREETWASRLKHKLIRTWTSSSVGSEISETSLSVSIVSRQSSEPRGLFFWYEKGNLHTPLLRLQDCRDRAFKNKTPLCECREESRYDETSLSVSAERRDRDYFELLFLKEKKNIFPGHQKKG